jgi:hypothetical protein
VQDVPLLVKFLAKFGLFVHVKLPGQKKSKSVMMYHSALKASYKDFSTFDGECFETTYVWEAGQASTLSRRYRIYRWNRIKRVSVFRTCREIYWVKITF